MYGSYNNKVIDQLNSFLRGEISAVETYRQALDKVTELQAKNELVECLRSHEGRVRKLQDKITELGGKPDASSGIWGAFAKLFEGGAKAFGERAAIAALEEGEDHGVRDYRGELQEVDVATRAFVERLRAEQDMSHRTMSNLKKSLRESEVRPGTV